MTISFGAIRQQPYFGNDKKKDSSIAGLQTNIDTDSTLKFPATEHSLLNLNLPTKRSRNDATEYGDKNSLAGYSSHRT